MKVTVDRMAALLGGWAGGDGALYARLARALGASLDRGELAPDDLLPTERELATRLSVSRATVVAAYAGLKEEGRLASRQGRGTWVAAAPAGPPGGERAFSSELYSGLLGEADGLIDLTAACPPPTALVREALAATRGADLAPVVAGRGYLPAGLPELRLRIAERLSGENLRTHPDEVLVTTGAQQAIALVTALLGAPGETALTEEVTYPGALDVLRGAGMRTAGVAMDEGGALPGALEEAMERLRPRFAYLVPTHQNPTGAAMSARRRRHVAELAARYRVTLVEDLALQHLVRDRSRPDAIAAEVPDAPVLTIGSLSKVLWGGLRVGWIRAPRPLIERLMRLRVTADLGGAVIDQAVAAALLPRLDEAVEERRAFLAAGWEALSGGLAELLPGWIWRPPRGGCALWVRLPSGEARGLAQVAQRCGVAIVPGPTMSAEGGHADHLRLAFVHEPAVVAEAVRRLARAWRLYAGAGTRPQRPPGVIV